MTEIQVCSSCGKPMTLRHRRSDGNPFWGCSGFPRCKNTMRFVEEQPEENFDWSEYQEAVFRAIENNDGNLVVEAVAGSGKTTTIVAGLKYTSKSSKVAFVAFNKRIATTLEKKAPQHVSVSTLHSLGLRNIKSHFGNKVQVDNRKFWLIWKGTVKNVPENLESVVYEFQHTFNRDEREKLDENAPAVNNLVSLCKSTMLDPTFDNLEYLCDHFGIQTNGDTDLIFKATKMVFDISVALIPVIVDFDDMIYAPASGIVPCEQFDDLFVDEVQDLNKAQIEFCLKTKSPNGRIIAVGDRAQSIYGFRGADTQAIPNVIKALDAKILPLSICYRCPKSHIEMAQQLVPTIQPFEKKDEGVVRDISFSEMMEVVKPGDLVMCRINAPLVGPAFELIRRGIKAIVLGRDIGLGLENLIKKIAKRNASNSLLDLLYDMGEYRDKEMGKLLAAKKGSRAASLDDQIETIIALASGCDTVDELFTKISIVFDDNAQGVVFSSIHKAKGTEADRTFILRSDLLALPQGDGTVSQGHPMATEPWEKEQEINCGYVAVTRAISEMYFVSGGF